MCVRAGAFFLLAGKLNRPFQAAAFGENITSEGLLESSVHIGDTFQLGEAVVQVSQPRQPCFKLAALYEEPKMPLFVKQSGYTGFYFRVLQEGKAARGMEIIPSTTHSARVTVQEANRIMNDSARTEEDRMKLLQLEELAESWKEPLRRQAEKL
ncbi:MOSC domain-containing protein [Domibacillus enclensis]|uniref:MOSC domain-containing protein n=1 Tax=Domibacillus enclensis TaxID=1017273 RepID=A0A1N6NHV2_9BACI|nr:MOSC domain-containing protein [Domibacillus enclensis]